MGIITCEHDSTNLRSTSAPSLVPCIVLHVSSRIRNRPLGLAASSKSHTILLLKKGMAFHAMPSASYSACSARSVSSMKICWSWWGKGGEGEMVAGIVGGKKSQVKLSDSKGEFLKLPLPRTFSFT